MKNLLLFVVLVSVQLSVSAQLNYKLEASEPHSNFYEIVDNTRAYFNTLKKNSSKPTISNKKAEKQFERWVYFWKDRVDLKGNFPSEILGYYNAGIIDENGKISKSKSKFVSAKTQTESWANIGPQENPEANGYPNYPQMGRLNTFLRITHPTDVNQDVLFVGAPDGGIWKSTNNGSTWSPKLDHIAGIGVTDIKTAPTTTFANYTTAPIYVSTGDYDGAHIKSIGVLKSTDGGETYASTGLSYSLSQQMLLGQLVVIDDNTVLVGENRYIKKTIDGGANWTISYDAGYSNANPGRVAYNGADIMYGGYFDVYFSSDSGATWSEPILGNTFNKHVPTFGSDGVFYVQDIGGQLMWYDFNADSFINLGNISGSYNSQNGYNQALIYKDGMFVSGEFNGQTSIDDGVTWYTSLNGYWANNLSPGTYIHSDHHGLGLLDGQYEFWSVNDGGLNFITYDNINDQYPTIEYKSNGTVVTQLYNVAITPNSATGNYIMANQDNDGFSKELHNGTMQWIALAAGDGICAVINYNNPDIKYVGGTAGSLSKANAGFSNNYNGDSFGTVLGAGFEWPLEIHTTDPTILYAGGDDIYKITDPSAASDIATSIANAIDLNSGAGQISKITTHGAGIAVVGDTDSKISINDGLNWTTLSIPGENINSIDFDQTTINSILSTTIYCSVSGYNDGFKVFRSTDGGANWTNISTGLPNIVMKEIVFKQNQPEEFLFLATELGVYYKKGNDDWVKLGGTSLPNVIVNDIDINYTEEKLVAATFGRGLWQINILNNTLAIEENQLENSIAINVYPNPVFNGELNFKIANFNEEYKYVIYNLFGGIVAQGKSNLAIEKLDVSNLKSGVYMFKVHKQGFDLPAIKFIVTN